MGPVGWTVVILTVVASVAVTVLVIRHKRIENEARKRYSKYGQIKEEISEARQRAIETGEPQFTAQQKPTERLFTENGPYVSSTPAPPPEPVFDDSEPSSPSDYDGVDIASDKN